MHVSFSFLGALLLPSCAAFTAARRPAPPRHDSLLGPLHAVLDGRGHDHLSASLEDGDVVCFQTGSWFVDGVAVGDGVASLAFATVTLMQLVFTHNCEHGWIYGAGAVLKDGVLRPSDDDDDAWLQFGPEQLVARLEGDDDGGGGVALTGPSLAAIDDARAAL